MSANRSVQAAQKRRAGPQDGGMSGKGPQPSINSSHMLSNQVKPGQGPNMPNGRLVGQPVVTQQQQQKQKQEPVDGISGVNKMTIAQAITLITLRLGAIETKFMKLEHETPTMTFEGHENMALFDKNVFDSFASRLESLEKRSTTGISSSPEVSLLKQQFELFKQTLVQTKGTINSVIKDNKDLKNQLDIVSNELTQTKELVTVLQNLTMDNSSKIMEYSYKDIQNVNGELNGQENAVVVDDIDNLTEVITTPNIVGTDLKIE